MDLLFRPFRVTEDAFAKIFWDEVLSQSDVERAFTQVASECDRMVFESSFDVLTDILRRMARDRESDSSDSLLLTMFAPKTDPSVTLAHFCTLLETTPTAPSPTALARLLQDVSNEFQEPSSTPTFGKVHFRFVFALSSSFRALWCLLQGVLTLCKQGAPSICRKAVRCNCQRRR
jgi:hypothetical protein